MGQAVYRKHFAHWWREDNVKALRGKFTHLAVLDYLMTGPAANAIGIFYLPLPDLCHALGVSREQACAVIADLSDLGLAYYDGDREEVWIPDQARWQFLESPPRRAMHAEDNNLRHIHTELTKYRESPFILHFYALYKTAFYLPPEWAHPGRWDAPPRAKREAKPESDPHRAPPTPKPLPSQGNGHPPPPETPGKRGNGHDVAPKPLPPWPGEAPSEAPSRGGGTPPPRQRRRGNRPQAPSKVVQIQCPDKNTAVLKPLRSTETETVVLSSVLSSVSVEKTAAANARARARETNPLPLPSPIPSPTASTDHSLPGVIASSHAREVRQRPPQTRAPAGAPGGQEDLFLLAFEGPWPSVQAFVELYNLESPDEWPMARLEDWTAPEARANLTDALTRHGERSFWECAIRHVAISLYLRGVSHKSKPAHLRPGLEWLISYGVNDGVENAMKVVRGDYDPGKPAPPPRSPPAAGAIRARG
jgi:hypothetical protein